jgi:signal transduction histidine kinase
VTPPVLRSRWPWLISALSILIALAATALLMVGARQEPLSTEDLVFLPVLLLAVAGYSIVGAILASRNVRNPIGWILLTVGFAFGWAQATQLYAEYTLRIVPGALPFGSVAAWVGTWIYAIVLSALPLLALLYPSGRVAGPRWRAVAWAVVACASVAAIGTALGPGSMEVETGFAVDNPFGLKALGPILELVGGIGWIGVLASIPVSIASLVLRFRRSQGEERQQIRWLVFVALAILVLLLATIATALIVGGARYERSVGPQLFFGLIFSLIAVGVPAALGVAVLRYRLYDLDLVIKKTIVFAILVLLLLALAGLGALLLGGSLVPSLYDRPPLLLLFGGAFGLLVIPAYRLARRIADRIVYGGRASPYEVGETYSTEDVLPRMAQLIGQATGADAARVWLKVGSELRPAAAWPAEAIGSRSLPSHDGELPDFEDTAVEIRHQGELLGALTLEMRPSDPMNPSKERIVRDLASQAGLVLRNVRLIEELRESRRRIVNAQDEERRRIERNIHDGAQQQLVALSVKLGLAERLVPQDPAKAVEMLEQAKAETGEAIEDLRDLARGIYPPVLADRGLVAALEGQARKSAVGVVVESDGIGRYSQETEAAVYFCCLEALQNVAKYSEATAATVRLAQRNGTLNFTVSDDGRGFDPAAAERGSGLQGIADRLAALGGTFEVRSAPGEGTAVSGSLPVIEERR